MSDGKIVGYLPREIFHPMKLFLDRRADLSVQLSSTPYWRSPLCQGDIENPCFVRISLPASIRGNFLIRRYNEFVEEMHTEPKEEVIVGCFVKKNHDTSININTDVPSQRKRKNPLTKATQPKNKDIRDMFQPNWRI